MRYLIQLGIISNTTSDSRKKDKPLDSIENYEKGNHELTNAEILFINEYGSPLRNLPARPVLQMTIDYFTKYELDKAIDKMINAYLKNGNINDLEDEIDRFCQRMQSYAQALIYDNDGRLKSNAPSTIKKKGFDHPLFITGERLARNITCIYSKIS